MVAFLEREVAATWSVQSARGGAGSPSQVREHSVVVLVGKDHEIDDELRNAALRIDAP